LNMETVRKKPHNNLLNKKHNVQHIVTPQNLHLADYSDHATIYMMSLWKGITERLVHIQHARDAGGIK
jgi:hypothetical protein